MKLRAKEQKVGDRTERSPKFLYYAQHNTNFATLGKQRLHISCGYLLVVSYQVMQEKRHLREIARILVPVLPSLPYDHIQQDRQCRHRNYRTTGYVV
jgi:hypothetical protein